MRAADISDDISEVLLTEEQIHGKLAELATQVAADYAGRDVVLVGVLKGAVMFVTDLARAIPLPTQLEFMAVSSYGSSTSSSGVVRILKDLDRDINDRDVLIVEDIVDTGQTLSWLLDSFEARHPRSLRTVSLLDKRSRRTVEVGIEHVGFTIEDRFVVGYGLDYDEQFRHLPYIAILDRHHQHPAVRDTDTLRR